MDNQDKFNKMLDRVANEAQVKSRSKTKTLTATMPVNLIDQVKDYAKATNQSRSKAISELVELGFKYLIDKTE